jgi:peptidoglycan/xylan/chitin deacetylase (PgdA/CDA1 family)
MRVYFKNTLRKYFYSLLDQEWIKNVASGYRGIAMCLAYHRVHPISKKENYFHPNLSLVVTPESFEEQIAYISQNYNCLDIYKAIDLLNNGKLPDNSVIVTFDDGYRDNLEFAFPILKKYSVPAELYITTGFPDGSCVLWWYEIERMLREVNQLRFSWKNRFYSWNFHNIESKYKAYREIRLLFVTSTLQEQQSLLEILRLGCNNAHFTFEKVGMSWDDIVMLDREPIVTIGSHTISHPSLTQLTDEEVYYEMKGSKIRLEEKLKHPVETFSYPFGSPIEVERRVSIIAKEIGYKCAVTSKYGHIQKEHKNHPYSIPRIPITFYDTIERFKIKLSGIYAMVRQRGRKVVTVY